MEEESIFSSHKGVCTIVYILIKLYWKVNWLIVPLTHKYLSSVCEIAMASQTDCILLSVQPVSVSVQLFFATQSTHK
jgi:hypothetical protein